MVGENAPIIPSLDVIARLIDPIFDTLESGVILVDNDGRIGLCTLAMATIFDCVPKDLTGLSLQDFNQRVVPLMDRPPALLVERGLFPSQGPVLCEEFEISRPTRTVARWVARKVRGHSYAMVAVCTDITFYVDLTLAYERIAQTDRLTGIANRRGIEREIKQEMLRLRRYETPLSFAMFDIDHFKRINDTYGHSVGDEVLREVAQILAKSLRDTDIVARWGGEEFLLVLPETAGDGARLCADRIRLAVAGAALPIPVTISAGVHQASPEESLTEILSLADKRLYLAKNSGRNRVC